MRGIVQWLIEFVRDPLLFENLTVLALVGLSVVMIVKTW